MKSRSTKSDRRLTGLMVFASLVIVCLTVAVGRIYWPTSPATNLATTAYLSSSWRARTGKVLGTSTPISPTPEQSSDQNSSDSAVWAALNGLQQQINIINNQLPEPATPTPSPSSDNNNYRYKLLQNVGPCQINQLGQTGWQLYQQGTVISIQSQQDENCNFTTQPQYGLDWAIFQKTIK